jgi:hypothetical protein
MGTFSGKRHTDETRCKMSEAAKRRWARGREGTVDSRENCFKKLMAAIIKQAVKDKAELFLESDFCQSYCAVAGINPVKLIGGRYDGRRG